MTARACCRRHPRRQARPPPAGQARRGPSDAAGQPAGPTEVVYGFGRIDASGRVTDRATIAALGWRGGDRLT
jgi:hypothetical protein